MAILPQITSNFAAINDALPQLINSINSLPGGGNSPSGLPIAQGGTGAVTAALARTGLGLGTIATQASTAVALTGGTIDGVTIGGTTPGAGTFTTLTGNGVVNVMSFGAVGDGITDSTAAVQAFFNAVTTRGYTGVLPSGTYLISAPLVITIGNVGFSILGASASSVAFKISASFSGGTSALTLVGTGTTQSFEIGGFNITPASTSGTATTGFRIGDPSVASTAINGLQFSKIKDVEVTNFPTSWDISHARMIYFERCGGWNASLGATNAINLYIHQNGAFTGDMVFDCCQFVTSNANANNNIYMYSPVGPLNHTTGYNAICGIKFRACDLYAGYTSIKMYAAAASYIADIWFIDGCQNDQGTNQTFYCESNGTGTVIDNIHISEMYMSQSSNGSIIFTSSAGGIVKSIWVNDNWLDNANLQAVNFYSSTVGAIQDVHVNGNSIVDCNNTSLGNGAGIEFNGVAGVECNFNSAAQSFQSQKPNYLIKFDSGTSLITCIGNNPGSLNVVTGTILDNSGAVAKTITSNLGYNPIGVTNITVTGSPFTYTNNTGSLVMASIIGGTISAITLEGWGITVLASHSLCVPTGASMVITYSSLPTLNVFGL